MRCWCGRTVTSASAPARRRRRACRARRLPRLLPRTRRAPRPRRRSRCVAEVADHALKRGGVDGDVAGEGVVDGDGDEQQDADDRAQTGRHDHVQHGAAEAEDHREDDGHHAIAKR